MVEAALSISRLEDLGNAKSAGKQDQAEGALLGILQGSSRKEVKNSLMTGTLS